MGALLEVEQVALAEPVPDLLWGWNIDRPLAGSSVDAKAVDIEGWVLGRGSRVLAVEFVQNGTKLVARTKAWPPGSRPHGRVVSGQIAVGSKRPDVGAAFPELPEAADVGFAATVVPMISGPQTEIEVFGVLIDQARVPLGTVRGRNYWRRSKDPAYNTLVSVVIPCFNQAHFLSQSVESALKQTHSNIEVVVIDDGSQDNTAAVAERFPAVKYIHQSNRGLSEARNAGLRASNGDLLIFLDADDRLLPNAAGTGLEYLEKHPEVAFVSGHYNVITAEGELIASSGDTCVDARHYEALLRGNYVGAPASVVYRRSVFEHVRGFSTEVGPCADHDLYLRVAREFPIACHHEVTSEYRLHGASMSRDSKVMLRAAAAVYDAQAEYTDHDEPLTAALKAGRDSMRNLYGEPLIDEVRTSLSSRDWRRAVTGFAALATADPGSLKSLVPQIRSRDKKRRRGSS